MLKNYLLIALRNLKKQKIFSMINIIGLAVGMAGFTIFAFIAGTKLNSDKFHKNIDNIYGVVQVLSSEKNKDEEHTLLSPLPLLPALNIEFPSYHHNIIITC